MKKNEKKSVCIINSNEIFQQEKPRFNAFQTGYGNYKDKSKYDRKANKNVLKKDIENY